MAEVRLAAIRIGFDYSVDITFPPGFLGVSDSVRMSLRRYVGDASPVAMADDRVGDTVTLTLTATQTVDMLPGSYIGEAIVYDTTDPTIETPLTNNRYIADCDYSPSE